MKHKSKRAFTMIELIVVLMIIGIVCAVIFRVASESVEDTRIQATIKELEQIAEALIGNEEVVRAGQRVDFGYIGSTGSFPANLGLLSGYFPSGADFQNDAWGTAYAYSDPTAATITLQSYGSDKVVGGTGRAEDIVVTFIRDRYVNNTLYVNVFDLRGTILRGDDAGDTKNQIHSVTLLRGGATVATLTLQDNTLFTATGLAIGRYTLRVTIANGTGGAHGSKDWRTYLNLGNATYDATIGVYPKGSSMKTVVAVRLPGALNQYYLEN